MNTLTNPTRLVLLIGNPNAGKTSLFNALTGEQRHVGAQKNKIQ
ncbi:MAG: FeoB small GTPase domain-containing protein [Candidatus Ozemobacteraceae bacterium]